MAFNTQVKAGTKIDLPMWLGTMLAMATGYVQSWILRESFWSMQIFPTNLLSFHSFLSHIYTDKGAFAIGV